MQSRIEPRRATSRRRRAALGLLALAAGLGLLASGAAPQGQGDEGGLDLEETRAALAEWVDVQDAISREKQEWALGKELLEDGIELVRTEIASLRAGIAEAEESIAEADRKRVDLVDENERLKAASEELAETVASLEARIEELLPRLPDPLRERVEPLSQRLPDDPEETRLSLGDRFMNVAGILTAADKYNREISVTSEVRALPDGSSAEVTALYVGVGQGYYVGGKGQVAGIGSSSEDGWSWRPADASAPEIARAIAILKAEDVASFVRLPIRID